MENLHIPTIAAEPLFTIGPITIVNTFITAWIVILIFLFLGLFLKKRLSLRPGKVQNALEFFIEVLLGYFDQVTGDRKKTVQFFPLVGTIFFFILVSNWMGILPGTGTLTLDHTPILRPANTDLNLTVAMALISVIASHIFAFVSIGFFTHLGKFVQIKPILLSFRKGPIEVFKSIIEFGVGFLEIVSEIAKVFSLSFRLFGNVFAGEILLSVMSALVGILVPAPFMLLEILVGLIQASVFAMLTLVYLTVASSAPHGDHATEKAH